jgi:hypothetical protein
MPQAKRVLISEGSSLSAREAITALGMAGHRVGVCDSDSLCVGRFSRFVTHFYRCPAFGRDPWAYLDFVVAIAAEGEWDVLFPTHEQAFLFSRERARIPRAITLAVADFRSFLQVQGKAALVKTLSRLSIPQPASRVIRTQNELEGESRFPFYVKANYRAYPSRDHRMPHQIDGHRASDQLGRSGYSEIHQACQDVAVNLAKQIGEMGPFELLSDGRDLPVFAWIALIVALIRSRVTRHPQTLLPPTKSLIQGHRFSALPTTQ